MREEAWALGHSVLALQRTGACCWPGGKCCLGTGVQPSRCPCLGTAETLLRARDREATPAPLILDAFSHESPADATGKARGQLLTMAKSLVVGEQHKEVVSASQAAGSCAFSSDSVVPKEQGKHRRVRETQLLCQQAYQLLRRALI